MGRACLSAIVVAGLATFALAGAAAAAAPAQPLEPMGGMWQSIPYAADAGEPSAPPRAADSPRQGAAAAKPQPAGKAAAPRPRHPVAAAAVSEPAPPVTAAARTRELERRLDTLLPGTRLGEPMADPENPAWRRPRPGRPGAEHNSLSVPFDEKGQAGLVGRGYYAPPDAQNPNGSTGATFGLRTRF